MRRLSSRLSALTLFVFLFGTLVAPVVGNEPPVPDTLDGTLVELVAESPGLASGHVHTDEHTHEWIDAVELENGALVELELSAGEAAALPMGGTEVEVEGVLAADGDSMEVSELSTTDEAPVMAAPVSRRVAVLMTNFVDDTRTPWTASAVAATYFSTAPTKSVASYYSVQSYDALSFTGDVLGYYTINSSRSSCDYWSWKTAAQNAATAAGVDLTSDTHVVIAFPQQAICWWDGMGELGSQTSTARTTWINGLATNWKLAAHEIGHNLGARHATSITCTDAVGVRVALSTSCTSSEYGDPFDVMGGGGNGLNTFLRYEAKLLTATDILTVTASGSYSVGVAGVPAAANRIVRIARPDGTYLALEFRQPDGFYESWTTTAAVVTGVSIRIAPAIPTSNTKLIDTTPATNYFNDAPLGVGLTFTDPASGVSITTTSAGAAGATVEINFPTPDSTPPPTASPPAASPTPDSTPTPTASPPAASPTPSPTPDSTPTPTASPPAASPTPSPTPDSTPTPTASPPAASPTPSPTATPTLTPSPTPTHFTDIARSTFRGDIEWLAGSGITSGCAATRFCPDQ